MSPSSEREWLARAIELAAENAEAGGRPFGAVVALRGTVVGAGVNRCLADNDPTAHAEVEAIRAATRRLATPRLDGAVIAASTIPCPMCQAAALLAGVTRIVFATDEAVAAARGYDARELLADLGRPLPARLVMDVTQLDMEGEERPYALAAAYRSALPSGDAG